MVWLDRVSDAALVVAGTLKARHRMSLAEAIIAAFVADAGATLINKDSEYESLVDEVRQEHLPYNAKRPSQFCGFALDVHQRGAYSQP